MHHIYVYKHLTVRKQKTDVKLLVSHTITWNHFTVCKQMSSNSFKNYYWQTIHYKSYIFNTYI